MLKYDNHFHTIFNIQLEFVHHFVIFFRWKYFTIKHVFNRFIFLSNKFSTALFIITYRYSVHWTRYLRKLFIKIVHFRAFRFDWYMYKNLKGLYSRRPLRHWPPSRPAVSGFYSTIFCMCKYIYRFLKQEKHRWI